jgi:hypothetical protein
LFGFQARRDLHDAYGSSFQPKRDFHGVYGLSFLRKRDLHAVYGLGFGQSAVSMLSMVWVSGKT